MSKKLLAILLALIVATSLVACNNKEEETTEDDQIKVPSESSSEINSEAPSNDETDTNGEQGSEIGTSAPTEIGDPGDYSYTECDQVVYVNNPDSAITLRSAEYKAMGSIAHGTELRRIGLSTDEANYWSKVIYEEKEYYVATKYLTTIQNPDEGFESTEKTVVVNEKTGALNIRNLPSMEESSIIGHANAGVEIKVIAENTTTGWYKVEFVNNEGETKTGFIASNVEYFVVETEAATSTATEAVTEATTTTATEAVTEATTTTATEVDTEVSTETAGK